MLWYYSTGLKACCVRKWSAIMKLDKLQLTITHPITRKRRPWAGTMIWVIWGVSVVDDRRSSSVHVDTPTVSAGACSNSSSEVHAIFLTLQHGQILKTVLAQIEWCKSESTEGWAGCGWRSRPESKNVRIHLECHVGVSKMIQLLWSCRVLVRGEQTFNKS